MAAGRWIGIAALCVAASWHAGASQDQGADASQRLVEAIRAVARERAGGGRMELRATCEAGGEGAVHVVIELPAGDGARAEILSEPARPEPVVAQHGEEAAAPPTPAAVFRPQSARRTLEELLAGIADLGDEAEGVRVLSLSSRRQPARRAHGERVRVKLDLELPAASQEAGLALYTRLRERWKQSESLRELGSAPMRPLDQEDGLAVDGLELSYEWPTQPLAEPAEEPMDLSLFVRGQADKPDGLIGQIMLLPREDHPRNGVVDRTLTVTPRPERIYRLDAVRRYLAQLEGDPAGATVTELHLERVGDDRWHFETDVTRRERAE
jgi:hypothetical protein